MDCNPIFYKPVNTKTKAPITEYLSKHFRYYTMNPWNRMTSYANRVKIPSLQIPAELSDKAYDFLSAECPDYNYDIESAIADFTKETGYSAGFNGRSGGYIVMYDTKYDMSGNRITIYHGIDEHTDFNEWSHTRLKERLKEVQTFDKLCDQIRGIFLYYLENTDIHVEEILVPTKRIIATLKDDNHERE